MVGLKYLFGLLGAQSCRKRKNHPQLVQFLHCDHGVQEVQWVQEVRSYHPYQQVQKIQQGPINTKTETSKSSQNELQNIQATVYMLQLLDQSRKITVVQICSKIIYFRIILTLGPACPEAPAGPGSPEGPYGQEKRRFQAMDITFGIYNVSSIS